MDITEAFQERYGALPDVVGSAPGRVNLIGEHLDYNGGRCLPIALTCRTEVAAAPREDGRIVVESLQTDGVVEVEVDELDDRVEGWSAYVLGVVWALDLRGTGYSFLVDGRVPTGSGLSSSAALECATATAVCEVAGVARSREDVVKACVRAENDYAGAATGSMDQTVAMFAEEGHAVLVDFRTGEKRPVPWHPSGELVVVDTKAAHELVGGEYADRRRSCEAAAEELGVEWLVDAREEQLGSLTDPVLHRRARHVVTETARVEEAVAAIEGGDWAKLGRLMTASHESLRDDYEVSCRELDVAVDAALSAGAWGARMTGGGFGGSAIALVPPGRAEQVREAVLAAYDAQGLRAPEFVDGTAGGPADVRRVERGTASA